jgi:tripartite-type tricarboxylate transporter receptor subunit TctC
MKRIALCFLFAFCFVPELRAEPAFFVDKTIRLVLGFSPGGISDLWARALARAMTPHIPGKPSIISQNIPGAGSLTAAN